MSATKINIQLPDVELRHAPATVNGTSNLSLTVTEDEGVTTLGGYAILWGQPSRPIIEKGVTFIERIQRGACRDSIKAGIACLVEHRPELILGKTPLTLQVEEDEIGLRFQVNLPDTQAGRDVLTSIKRGDIGGCSFNMRMAKSNWARDVDGLQREVTYFELNEITLTAFPSYPQSMVEIVKQYDGYKENQMAIAKVNAEIKKMADEEYAKNLKKIRDEQAALDEIIAKSEARKKNDPKLDLSNPGSASALRPAKAMPKAPVANNLGARKNSDKYKNINPNY